jgi:hypothetical protein
VSKAGRGGRIASAHRAAKNKDHAFGELRCGSICLMAEGCMRNTTLVALAVIPIAGICDSGCVAKRIPSNSGFVIHFPLHVGGGMAVAITGEEHTPGELRAAAGRTRDAGVPRGGCWRWLW